MPTVHILQRLWDVVNLHQPVLLAIQSFQTPTRRQVQIGQLIPRAVQKLQVNQDVQEHVTNLVRRTVQMRQLRKVELNLL